MKFTRSILITLSCISFGANAQSASTVNDAKEQPVWIQMMNDESVNYFETVEAFNSYFKTHPKPDDEVEEQLMSGNAHSKIEYEREMKRENKKMLTEEERKALVDKEQMIYQVKRFRNWMKEMKPFVQEDGHILSTGERTEIWERQQVEMKNNLSDKK